jgi:hypothetical protein
MPDAAQTLDGGLHRAARQVESVGDAGQDADLLQRLDVDRAVGVAVVHHRHYLEAFFRVASSMARVSSMPIWTDMAADGYTTVLRSGITGSVSALFLRGMGVGFEGQEWVSVTA